ncbi:MAG TPA: hypothetical protein P5250_02025 [Bacteroidales bacterium]|nr:hypothetical protein [Bacteroidales bacterium]
MYIYISIKGDSLANLDISSSDKEILIPKMWELERNAITNLKDGLIIYNLTTECLNYYSNSQRYELCGNNNQAAINLSIYNIKLKSFHILVIKIGAFYF